MKEPVFDIQRKIVANMVSESWRSVPHVCFSYEPDVTAFEEAYRHIKPAASFNTFLLRAIVEGLKAAPLMNSHIEFHPWTVNGTVTLMEEIQISMPVILQNGRMMTLNLPGCEKKSLQEMQRMIDDVLRRAAGSNLTDVMMETAMENTRLLLRKGNLFRAAGRVLGAKIGKGRVPILRGAVKREYRAHPETERLTIRDLKPGTVTVSNFGSLYKGLRGRPLLLEIIPPQTTAFGIGAIQDVPGFQTESGEVVCKRMLPICVAFDHRAMDFGDVIPFLKRMDELFAHPEETASW